MLRWSEDFTRLLGSQPFSQEETLIHQEHETRETQPIFSCLFSRRRSWAAICLATDQHSREPPSLGCGRTSSSNYTQGHFMVFKKMAQLSSRPYFIATVYRPLGFRRGQAMNIHLPKNHPAIRDDIERISRTT
jgi:hypothetical protein